MSPSPRKPAVTVTPRLLGERQSAIYLGVSVDTFRRIVGRNEIPVVKVLGRGIRARRMFDKTALDRWIEANQGLLAD